MRRVTIDLGLLDSEQRDEWLALDERSRKATANLISAEPGARKFESGLWSDIKRWLLANAYNGKCGYCEAPLDATSFGDADHWRPKGAVSVCDAHLPQPTNARGDIHPGYWWLAYEWSNLVPACQRCNSTGKGTQFPVSQRHVFGPPADVVDVNHLDEIEGPLLLHPVTGPDPADHLVFDDVGQVSAFDESELGKQSISVYGLTRHKLREGRWREIQSLEDAMSNAVAKALIQKVPVVQVLGDRVSEAAPYSQAVGQHLKRLLKLLVPPDPE